MENESVPSVDARLTDALASLEAAQKRVAELEAKLASVKPALAAATSAIEQAANMMEGHQYGCIIVQGAAPICGWGCTAARKEYLLALAVQLKALT